MQHNEIEAFVREIAAGLDEMPPERRDEVTRELSDHLRAMLDARLADGQERDAAWQAVRHDFGSAEEVAAALLDEWRRGPRLEVQGEPLSRREKMKMWARPLAVGLIFYPLMLAVVPWLREQNLISLLPLFSLACLGFGMWRWRCKGGQWTRGTMLTTGLSLLLFAWQMVALRMNGKGGLIHLWMAVFFAVGFVAVSLMMRRELPQTRPWQQLPRYKTSPVAAEEEYRMSSVMGLAAGSIMGTIMMLWMGWQFFGFGPALIACAVLLAFDYVFYRALR